MGVQPPLEKHKEVLKPKGTHEYRVHDLMSIKLISGSLQAMDN